MHEKYIFVLMLCIIECGAGKCSRIDNDMSSLFVALFLLVPSLQQTVPPGDVAVCPLSTVQYTCVADNELQWRTAVLAGYTLQPIKSMIQLWQECSTLY